MESSAKIEILPGNPGKPLFPDQDSYLKFSEEFCATVKPELDLLAEKRRKSEEAARFRVVG